MYIFYMKIDNQSQKEHLCPAYNLKWYYDLILRRNI